MDTDLFLIVGGAAIVLAVLYDLGATTVSLSAVRGPVSGRLSAWVWALVVGGAVLLFALPFLMPDHKAIDALTQGRVGQKMFEILAERDVVPLAWGENGFREISNS